MALLEKWRLLPILVVATLLASCSYLPEQLDPIDWVDSANDWVKDGIWGEDTSGPESEARISKRGTLLEPNREDPFPSLSEVPDERPSISTFQERELLAEKLIADRENANYTDSINAPRSTDPLPEPRQTAQLEGREPELLARPIEETKGLVVENKVHGAESVVRSPDHIGGSHSDGLPIVPPPTQSIPDWGTVEEHFYAMFQASGGSGGSLEDYTISGGPQFDRTANYSNSDSFASPMSSAAIHAAVIFFDHGSSRLSREDKEVLRQVVAAQEEFGGIIRVVGHASSRTKTNDVIGHQIANYETSLARARVVANEIIRLGVTRDKVFFEAMADKQPDYSEATTMGEAGNRRANIYIDFDHSQN